jgi:hypothetical protein
MRKKRNSEKENRKEKHRKQKRKRKKERKKQENRLTRPAHTARGGVRRRAGADLVGI